MKYSNKDVGKERSNMIPFELPKLNANVEQLMTQNFDCKKPIDFEHGILNAARKKFNAPLNKVGFVQIIADTKMSMPNTEINLIDGNKKTNWISTLRKNPQVTLYFPFHLLTLNAIGLRSHFEPHFDHFLEEIIIEGMNDEKEWKLIGYYYTRKLKFLGAKNIFEFDEIGTFRAIRIVNASDNVNCRQKAVQFGLSIIELFGTAEYNVSHTPCSENTFRDLIYSLYHQKSKLKKINTFQEEPKRTLKSKIYGKTKKWEQETDYEDARPDLHELMIEAKDKNGPSLIPKLEKLTGKPVSLYYPEFSGLVSSFDNKPYDSGIGFYIDFNFLILEIDEIKVTTDSENVPDGFIVAAMRLQDENEFEPYVYIDHLPFEPLSPKTEYFIKFPDKTKYIGLLIFPHHFTCNLKKIDIYGAAYTRYYNENYLEEKKKRRPKSLLIPCLRPCLPPIELEEEGDIFEPMKKYHGPNLSGFVYIIQHLGEDKSMYYYYNFIEGEILQSTNYEYPAICFYFYYHEVQISKIKLTTLKTTIFKKHFIIGGVKYHDEKKDDEYILFDGEVDFTNDKTVTIELDKKYVDEITITCNYPFALENFSFIGTTKFKKFCIEKDENFMKNDTFIKKKAMPMIYERKVQTTSNNYTSKFLKEIIIKTDSNPEVVYSAKPDSKMDLMQYGSTIFANFHTFYNIGNDNDSSLYKNNEENVWVPIKPNDSKFTIYLKNHSAKLTHYSFSLAKDSEYEKYKPIIFFLFGYNAQLKRWDVISSIQKSDLELGQRFVAQINNKTENNYYKAFCFYTYTEHLALSRFQLYGDLVQDDAKVDTSVFNNYPTISYNNMPFFNCRTMQSLSLGILRGAVLRFGPQLKNFVQVYCEKNSPNTNDECIWGKGNEPVFKYKSSNERKPKIITLYFPNHEVYLEGYKIKKDPNCNIHSWAIGTHIKFDKKDAGLILEKKKNSNEFEKYDTLFYRFDFEVNTKRPCRFIRFYGLEKVLSFTFIDFFGIAVPAKNLPLSQEDLASMPYPQSLNNDIVEDKPKPKPKPRQVSSDDDDDDDDENDYDIDIDFLYRRPRPKTEVQKEPPKKEEPEMYFCQHCGARYQSVRDMCKYKCNNSPTGYHSPFAGNGNSDFYCKYCGAKYYKLRDLCSGKCPNSPTGKHIPGSGDTDSKIFCRYCGTQNVTVRKLCDGRCYVSPTKKHVHFTGNPEGPFYCKICGNKYLNKRDFFYYNNCYDNKPSKKHVLFSGDPNGPFFCKYCGAKYGKMRDLISNRCYNNPKGQKHHPYAGGEKRKYACKYCGASYQTIRDMVKYNCSKNPNKQKHVPAK